MDFEILGNHSKNNISGVLDLIHVGQQLYNFPR